MSRPYINHTILCPAITFTFQYRIASRFSITPQHLASTGLMSFLGDILKADIGRDELYPKKEIKGKGIVSSAILRRKSNV